MEYMKLFRKYLSACSGDNEARWCAIRKFEPYIDKVCGDNSDMKHTIILSLFDLFDEMNEEFEKFFNEINA